ncbi:MAG: transcription elongation factor GreA [Candidatus Adiutrix sp.]|jgi:hypothetical protein|nr:transcription elongation factor GreA [Candidatus Adiutrix sp.]
MNQGRLADYANVSPIFGAIIGRNLATLRELSTVYSLPDALDLLEIITVQNYNEWAALEESRKNHG